MPPLSTIIFFYLIYNLITRTSNSSTKLLLQQHNARARVRGTPPRALSPCTWRRMSAVLLWHISVLLSLLPLLSELLVEAMAPPL